MEPFSLTSPAFEPNGRIPSKYTCDGENISPPLLISGVPGGTQSLVLIMDDPDIPAEVKKSHGIEVFDHWTVFNIPPETTELPEGQEIGTPGLNGVGAPSYTGPCPPPQYEPKEHRYIFTLYALKDRLTFQEVPAKEEVINMLGPSLIGKTELIGRYSRA